METTLLQNIPLQPNIFYKGFQNLSYNHDSTTYRQTENSKDHAAFLEKRREIYLYHQKQDRDRLIAKSRKLLQIIRSPSQSEKEEEEEIVKQRKQQEEKNIEDIFESFSFSFSQEKQNISQSNKSANQEDFNFLHMDSEGNCSLIENQEKNEKNDSINRRGTNIKQINIKTLNKNKAYASLLVNPEFMIDIPQNLSEGYFVIPRPNGRRCLVTVQGGYANCRDKNGIIFSRFRTEIRNESVLDCIHQKNSRCFIILDAIQYGHVELQGETTEFRKYWLEKELYTYTTQYKEQFNENKFVMAPYYSCTQKNLRHCYQSQYPYLKEGLLFVNKEANYVGGVQPNFLVFKDSFCSLYPMEISSENAHSQELVPAVLEVEFDDLKQCLCLQTLDKVFISELSKENAKQFDLKSGSLVKIVLKYIEITNDISQMQPIIQNSTVFKIQEENEDFEIENFAQAHIQVKVEGVQIMGKSSHYKCFADSLSKIVFQYKIRYDPIRFEKILGALNEDEVSANGGSSLPNRKSETDQSQDFEEEEGISN